MKQYKVGIMSTAKIVDRVVQGMRESERMIPYAIAGRSIEKAEEFAKRLSIPYAYDDYQLILQQPEIDLVYICNYNGGHFAMAKEAILHHKHVLCEKPLTLTRTQSEELFQLAKRHQVFLMEAQKALFLPAIQYVKKQLEEKQIGKIQYIHIASTHTGKQRGEWFNHLSLGGGILRGAGTYGLELTQYFIENSLETISATMQRGEQTSDYTNLIHLLADGSIPISLLISTEIQQPAQYEIYGEKGTLILPKFWRATEVHHIQNGITQIKNFESASHSEFIFELQHVAQCLDKGLFTSPIMTPALSLQAIQIIDAIYQEQVPDLIIES